MGVQLGLAGGPTLSRLGLPLVVAASRSSAAYRSPPTASNLCLLMGLGLLGFETEGSKHETSCKRCCADALQLLHLWSRTDDDT